VTIDDVILDGGVPMQLPCLGDALHAYTWIDLGSERLQKQQAWDGHSSAWRGKAKAGKGHGTAPARSKQGSFYGKVCQFLKSLLSPCHSMIVAAFECVQMHTRMVQMDSLWLCSKGGGH
jgi:hypothetical protein